jgi:adenosine deaminase
MLDWIRRMPKAELHLHLDGSLRPETALELARTRPARWPASISPIPDGPDALTAMRSLLVAPPHCRDQAELLRAFDLPVALLQDAEALERVAEELMEDLAGDGTAYAEVRWAPGLHTRAGLTPAQVIEAVAAGTRRGASRFGIDGRLIVVAMRTHGPDEALSVARAAADGRQDGVVGLDLAGPEDLAPDVTPFAPAFRLARDAGLGVTCHAGEWGGAGQVRAALALSPSRIAHGAVAAGDGPLVEALRVRGVTLDVCPTSNVQAGTFAALADHPLPRLVRQGVPVTISTDDRTVSELDLVEEYRRAVDLMGLTPRELVAVARHAHVVAFLHDDETLRGRLLAGFDAWAAADPDPGSA